MKLTLENHLQLFRSIVSWADNIHVAQRFDGFEVAYYDVQSTRCVLAACDWRDFDDTLPKLTKVSYALKYEPTLITSGEPTHYECDRINYTAGKDGVFVYWLNPQAKAWQSQWLWTLTDGVDVAELFGGV